MNTPANMTREYDAGHARGGKFSTDAVLIVNPAASRDDVLALALERSTQLFELIDTLTCCSASVAFDVDKVANLFCGPADDVRMLLTALQAMDRKATSAEEPE